MLTPELSRRAFIAAGGAVALVACTGTDSSKDKKPSGTSGQGVAKEGLQALRVSSDLYATDTPQRFAFIFTFNGEFVSEGDATLAVRQEADAFGDDLPAVLHTEGLPKGRGIYTLDLILKTDGIWEGRATLKGKSVKLFFQVLKKPLGPIPGGAAPAAPSPTAEATLGVDPICTRDPACPLHTKSLDALIGKGRPVAVMFATPARCQTQFCGPVLDQLLAVQGDYSSEVDFVHVEIYESTEGTNLVSTISAWGIDSEPWLFTVSANGTVQERLDGAFATDEIRGALDRLIA
ncbi:MAG: thioredoxin family protein [Actinomycetes bacterium]